MGDWHELVVLAAERQERSWRGRDGGEVDVQCPAYAADRGGVVDGSNGQTDACNGWWSGGLGRVPPLPQPKPTTSHAHEGIGIPMSSRWIRKDKTAKERRGHQVG